MIDTIASIVISTLKCSALTDTNMTETKFIISGRFERPNGWVMRDELAYISPSKKEAIETCQRLNPNFHIHTVREED